MDEFRTQNLARKRRLDEFAPDEWTEGLVSVAPQLLSPSGGISQSLLTSSPTWIRPEAKACLPAGKPLFRAKSLLIPKRL